MKSIIYNDKKFDINWDKTVLWTDKGGLVSKPGTYRERSSKRKRAIKFFVNHWDVCLSSKSCARVLNKRGISVHFCIDNDGTIYQLMDMQHVGWHAGGRNWNNSCVGVEISNAYYPKYQKDYVKKGFGERPMLEGVECQGRVLDPFMDFYPVQIEALKELWKAVHNATGIPYQCPVNDQGKVLTAVDPVCAANKFSGFISHYHLTKRKIDCAGLDLVDLLEQVNPPPPPTPLPPSAPPPEPFGPMELIMTLLTRLFSLWKKK